MATSSKPAWLQQILDDYRAEVANVFLLYGNVFDYVEHPERSLTVRDYLGTTLAALFTVAQYAPDEGITFAGPPSIALAARKRFERVLDLGAEAAPDPFLGASGPAAGGEVELPKAPTGALPLLVDFLKRAGDDEEKLAAVLVDRLDLICPPADKGTLPDTKAALLALLHRAGTSRDLTGRGALLLLLAPTLEEVHPDLRLASSGIRAIEIPPPAYSQRLAYCERVVREKQLTPEMPTSELAAQTAGLGYRHIEDLALRAEASGGAVTRTLVRERKAQMIASEYAEVLEVLEPDVTLDMVGGHDLVKAYLADYVIAPMRDDDLRDFAPKGIFLVGPPGTGKTFLCRAVAREIGINCVLLRADKIKGSYVGQSERLLARALSGIRALAPCVVFVDEIDQQFRRNTGGSGDGGSAVEANQFGRLLEFFGDPSLRGEVLLIAASNRPDLVDAAFKRAGRIDVKLPLLPPADASERFSMLWTIVRRHGFGLLDQGDLSARARAALQNIANDTEEWTPAELEALVVKAKAIIKIKRIEPAEGFAEARRRTKNAVSAETYLQTRLALAECDDPELVPERYRPFVGEPAPTALADEVAPERARRAGRSIDL